MIHLSLFANMGMKPIANNKFNIENQRTTKIFNARVVKLVDTHALGACAVKSVSVRVRPRAPVTAHRVINKKLWNTENRIFLFW